MLPDISPDSWQLRGGSVWAGMASSVNYQFSIVDTSEMVPLHQRIGTAPVGIFVVIKAAIGSEYGCEALNWIEYTGAYLDGVPYTPPGGWPWVGINVGGRDDRCPYSETEESHKWTIEGCGAGWHGVVRNLYDPQGFDAVFLNWPTSGWPHWKHESVVVLVGRWDGVDHVAGALRYMSRLTKRESSTNTGPRRRARPISRFGVRRWQRGIRNTSEIISSRLAAIASSSTRNRLCERMSAVMSRPIA